MLTIAPPDAAELRENATFEALMWSMARRGERRPLPDPRLSAVIETLIDLESTVFVDDQTLRQQAAAIGGRLTDDLAEADHVFLPKLDSATQSFPACAAAALLIPMRGRR